MAQHDASLEKTLQSVFRHKKVGTEVAVAILAIEAMVASGIDTAAIVEQADPKVIGRMRAGCSHKAIGKRMADAVATLDAIMATETISATATPGKIEGSAHKAALRPQVINGMSHKATGTKVADMAEKAEPVIDALLVIYGVGGAKADTGTAAQLTAIKAVLAA